MSLSSWCSRENQERGDFVIELILFIAGIVLPLGGFFFWLMKALLQWFEHMEILISGPFL